MTTAISWTDETWNSIVGCSRISPGCLNCYAATAAASARLQKFEQYRHVAKWKGEVAFVESQLAKPFQWSKSKKIFVCSMSDLFHPNVKTEWQDVVFATIALNPQHIFQVLTKRPENAVVYFSIGRDALLARWEKAAIEYLWSYIGKKFQGLINLNSYMREIAWPLPNLWFGATTENQEMLDNRSPLLSQVPAVVRWLSVEPLLGPINLKLDKFPVDWIVIGGESGKGYRTLELDWLTSVVNQSELKSVPLFIKQDSCYQSGKQGRISDKLWDKKEFPQM